MTGYARPPPFDPGAAETVLAPETAAEGYWTGAPCVHDHGGETYLAVRERVPEDRGRAVVLYRRAGDTDYEEVVRLAADVLDVVSVERPALATDPATGELHLYLPVDHGANQWTIQKLAPVPEPRALDPTTARDVLRPAAGTTDRATVKDPYVLTVGGRFYMFYSGSDGRSEQAHLATSLDGVTWERVAGTPILERQYWHDHHTRVACAVPAPDAPVWLVFYEGSGATDEGRTWNLRTGVAVSPDLREFVDTTPDGPVYQAPTTTARTGLETFATCRYLDVRPVADGWEVFAEVAGEAGEFELRWQRLDRN